MTESFADRGHRLDVHFPTGQPPQYGFMPVVLTATNPGSAAARWMVTVGEMNSHSGMAMAGHTETLVVDPGQTVERLVLVAVGKTGSVSWQNRSLRVVTPSGSTDHGGSYWSSGGDDMGVSVPMLLGARAAGTEAAKNALADSSSRVHGSFDARTAPGDWRAYTAYAVVVIDAVEWQAMSPAARSALGDWARLGGHLQFLGEVPPDAPVADGVDGMTLGLGGVYASPVPEGDELRYSEFAGAKAGMAQATPAVEATGGSWGNLITWLKGDTADLLRDRFQIWPMLLVVAVFVVVIAPVNLFLLAPSRRRNRLFLTTPVISLCACVILVGSVLLRDGLGGKGERLVWIESRPEENRHFVTQWQASRCGALFSDRFTVNDAAFLAPILELGLGANLRVGGDSLRGGGGWFTSRASQAHFLQAARPGRGRVELTERGSEGVAAVSTFDFPLRDVYASLDGSAWWYAPEMLRGEAVTFRPVEGDEMEAALGREIEGMPRSRELEAMARRPGHFIGYTDRPAAIETLGSVRWNDRGVVTGALATP